MSTAERVDPAIRGALVTGASGFVGSWLVGALRARGARVVGLARGRSQPPGGAARDLVMVLGDARDPEVVADALRRHDLDTVFHLAGQSNAGRALREPLETFEANVASTWGVMEAARRAGRPVRVVLASSELAGGEVEPTHPYPASKRCAEAVARSYGAAFDVPVGIARCGNVFGPGDPDDSRIVPSTVLAVLRGERPVIRSDGSPLRDYLHVADLAEGLIALATALPERRDLHGRRLSFASGRPVSVLDLTRTILELAGRSDLEPRILDEVRVEPGYRGLSAPAAATTLGWRPARSLEERLEETIAWYRRSGAAG